MWSTSGKHDIDPFDKLISTDMACPAGIIVNIKVVFLTQCHMVTYHISYLSNTWLVRDYCEYESCVSDSVSYGNLSYKLLIKHMACQGLL